MALLTYAAARRPSVNLDCSECQGTGIGYPFDTRCQGCRGRGYFTHTVDLDCECDGCREFRGEIDEDGNAIEREEA
jgi:predicted nucleic acid binding AN1-type Zn finger protein